MFGRCSAAFARFIVCAAAAGAARREGPLWIVTGRPEGERARSALTYLLVTTIYDGDRIDHGQLERRASAREITCRDDGLGRRTRTAVHRNIDVILPRSHSCSKKAPRRRRSTPPCVWRELHRRKRKCRQRTLARAAIISQIAVMTNSGIKEGERASKEESSAATRGSLSTSD